MVGGRLYVSEVLQQVIEAILREVRVDRPPVDAMEVARRLRLEVRINRQQQARGQLVQLPSQPTITVRPEPRSERLQWTVAHEIGEHLMPRLIDELGEPFDPPTPEARESIANRFASLLLVPEHWLRFDSRMTGFDLFALKSLYATASYEVLAYRLLDLDPPTIITVFDHGRPTRRQGNLPYRPPALLAPERSAHREAHERGTASKICEAGLSVQAWPIHEREWKREILRTVIDLDVGFADDP